MHGTAPATAVVQVERPAEVKTPAIPATVATFTLTENAQPAFLAALHAKTLKFARNVPVDTTWATPKGQNAKTARRVALSVLVLRTVPRVPCSTI